MTPQTAGYSGTPLAKKLGIKEGFFIRLINAPVYYFDLFTDLPEQISIQTDDPKTQKDFIHFFTKDERRNISKRIAYAEKRNKSLPA